MDGHNDDVITNDSLQTKTEIFELFYVLLFFLRFKIRYRRGEGDYKGFGDGGSWGSSLFFVLVKINSIDFFFFFLFNFLKFSRIRSV